jgi:hypothetical protein
MKSRVRQLNKSKIREYFQRASGNPKSLAEERAFSELVYEHDIHVVST